MFDRDTELADFNTHIRDYSTKIFFVAGRFFDLSPARYIDLSCIWYSRHGWRELKDDRYIGKLPNDQDAIRYHSVDAIVLENPKMDATAQMIYERWLARKTQLDRLRNEPDKKIEPPPPEPPKAKPVELPKDEPKPEKPQRPEWLIKASVWLTVLTPLAGVVSFFLPSPWNVLGKVIFEALKLIVGG